VPVKTKPSFKGLLPQEEPGKWLQPFRERAQARLFKFQPVTAQDRLDAFKGIHFQPHGLYLPDDPDRQLDIRQQLMEMGKNPSEDMRLVSYTALQHETAKLAEQGIPGKWTGQQAVARSEARFRIVAWGRRGGKTFYAASEAIAIAMARPRSWVWLAAPIARLAGRAFDYVVQYVQDLGIEDQCSIRNQTQEKQILFPNGSRIEGISLENYMSAAGAAIDFAVVDEAAQIVPEAWYRAILPPLMDRNGGALLISSYEGEGDFFSDKVLEVQKEEERAKALGYEFKPEWELFQAASYDVNFYAFPQGLNTKTLVDARKEMPVVDFLEQFGAQVSGSRDRIFSEFFERVHVGNYPYNPEHPVRLAIDPSSGANPYAIAVIQDYGDYMVIIDEFYERNTKVEEYHPMILRRPWAENVVDGVIDSAWPSDIVRWNELGWRVYPVSPKPQVEDSVGIVKEMLRNSRLYDSFYRARLNWFLQAAGYEPDTDAFLPKEVMHEIVQKVEESLAPENLSDDVHCDGKDCDHDVCHLRMANRIFVNRSCVNTILEFKSYSWKKRRNLNMNFEERPRKYQDHLMDAIRYYIWMNHRFAATDHPKLLSYMSYRPPKAMPEGVMAMPTLTSQQRQGMMWLEHHRNMHARTGGVSYLSRRV
jgi:hypothetical protein